MRGYRDLVSQPVTCGC